ncbi:MAG: V-type ATP synthase subunit E [Tepidanaerobacteraceae bacterium]|jgi:V/A-type H+-transporting ATPase subunit E|nr:V-type ATP synthase subunit E [Tepidanaerobacteraceae bacterium]
MEGIEKIKERIMQEALQKQREILDKARAEADKIIRDSAVQVEEIKRQSRQKAERMAEEEKRKILSMAELDERKRLLSAKQQIIDGVFEKARQELENMPADDYLGLMRAMLIKASAAGDEEIIVNEKDKNRITTDFLNNINGELKKQGKTGGLRLSAETRPIIGGFILKSSEMEINSSFDALIKAQRDELETEISKTLFEE